MVTFIWTLRKIQRKSDFEYQVIDPTGAVVATRRSKRHYVACFVYVSNDAEGGSKRHCAATHWFGRPELIGKGDSGRHVKALREPDAIALIETIRDHSRPGAWSDYPLTRTPEGEPIENFEGTGMSWYGMPTPYRRVPGFSTAINRDPVVAKIDDAPVDLGDVDAEPADLDPIEVISRIVRPIVKEFCDVDRMTRELATYLWNRLEGTDPADLAANVAGALKGIKVRVDYGGDTPASNAAEGVAIADRDSAVNRLWRDRNRPADQPKTDNGPAIGWKD